MVILSYILGALSLIIISWTFYSLVKDAIKIYKLEGFTAVSKLIMITPVVCFLFMISSIIYCIKV